MPPTIIGLRLRRRRWAVVLPVLALLYAATASDVGAEARGVVREGAAATHSSAVPLIGAEVNRGARAESSSEVRQRAEWFYRQRAYPYDSVPTGALQRAQVQADALARLSNSSQDRRAAPTAILNWTSWGPRPITAGRPSVFNGAAPWSGRVTVIAHSPANAAVAFLGSADGGVWKTTDSGAHWIPRFDTQPSLAIGSISVDPSNTSRVFVGTGEPNGPSGGPDSYFGAGIFRSTDGGTSWTKIGGSTFDTCYVSNIAVQPRSSSTLFVAVGNQGRYVTACPSGVYRSLDGGVTWSNRLSGPVSDLVVRPGYPATWYAALRGLGIWRSTNDGVSWIKLAGGLPTSNVGRISLGVTSANSSRIYAAIGNIATGGALGVWISANTGSTWTKLPYRNFCAYRDSDTGGQCDYDLAIAGYPGNQAYVYVAGIRLQRWNGSTWKTLGYDGVHTTGIHVDFHTLSFDALNRLWAGSDGGAYRKDAGTNDLSGFRNLNATLGITQFYPGTSGVPSATFLGGTQDNGSLQHTNAGSWYELEGGDGGYTALDAAHAAKFTTYVFATVQRDTPNGHACWLFSAAVIGPSCIRIANDPALFIAPLVQGPAAPSTLFVGTNRIWRTTNDGTSWAARSPAFSGYVSAIAQAKSNSKVLFASWSHLVQSQGGTAIVRRSTDGGVTWSVTAPLPDRFITDIVVKRSASNVAWVTVSGYDTGHVFLTQNSGATWTNVSGNLPNAPVNAITVDTRTSPSTLYVATDVGVFWSIDGGTSWANTSVGLPHSVVTDIRVDLASNTLVAATHGRGVFTAPVPSP